MPIFEYICKDCRKRFEALVHGTRQTECPLCGSTNLDQQISTFSVGASRNSRSQMPACAGSCNMAGGPGCCPNLD